MPTQNFLANRLRLGRLRDFSLETGPREPNRRLVPTLKMKFCFGSPFSHVSERPHKISWQTELVLTDYETYV